MPTLYQDGDVLETVHLDQMLGEANRVNTGGTGAAYEVSNVLIRGSIPDDGTIFNARIHATNLANATFKVNDGLAKPIVTADGQPLLAGELVAGQIVSLIYDVARDAYQVLTGVSSGGAAESGIDTQRLADGSVSNSEFICLDGVTAPLQQQLDSKAALSHGHIPADIIGQIGLAQGGSGRDNSGNNVALGSTALTNATGHSNTAMGALAGSRITTGTNNLALGRQAMAEVNDKTGANNVALGYLSLANLSSGYGNVAVGSTALRNATTGFRNVAVGDSCLRALTTGNSNVAMGYLALDKITTQSNNTAVGTGAGFNLTSGHSNTFLGFQVCYSGAGATGNSNVGVGHNAFFSLTSGAENVAVGAFALYTTQAESGCVAIGHQAGYNLSGGGTGGNVFLGWLAGRGTSASTASQSVAVGTSSLTNVSSGIENTAVGGQSLQNLSTGQRNAVLGQQAGQFISSGSNNTLMGRQAANNLTTGSDNLILGSGVQAQSPTENQQINLANGFRRSGSQGASSVTSRAASYANGSTTTILNLTNRRGRVEFFDSNNDWAVLRFLGTTLVLESGSGAYLLSNSPGASQVGLHLSGSQLQVSLGSSAARQVGWTVNDIEF